MVALLYFTHGEPFATGRAECEIGPASSDDLTNRVILRVAIAGIETRAVLDTGAPYVVCAPTLLGFIKPSPSDIVDRISAFTIRGRRFSGNVYSLDVTFPASEGQELKVEAAVFIPELRDVEEWGALPSFIGLTGCLERMRFAVDADMLDFYFGSIGQSVL